MPRNFPRDPSHQVARDAGEGAPADIRGGKSREGEVRKKDKLPPRAANPGTEPPKGKSPRDNGPSSDDDNSGIDVA